MFMDGEICDAVARFLNSKIGRFLGHTHLKVERVAKGSVVVSFRKNEFGARDREVIPTDDLTDALTKWCRSKGSSLPARGTKTILKIGKILCLRVSNNIQDEKVESVEQLILRSGGKP